MSKKKLGVVGHWLKTRHRFHWHVTKRTLKIAAEFVGVALLALAVLSVILQLLYPADRTLPFARLGGLDVGGKDRTALVAQLGDYAQYGETTIKTPSREWQTKWQDIGVTIDSEASADVSLGYEWWERLLPFSSVIRLSRAEEMPLIALADTERLRTFAEKIVAEDKLAAREAVVTFENGEVKIDGAKNGYQYSVEDVERQVRALPVSTRAVVQLVPQPVAALRAEAEIAAVKAEAETILSRSLSLKAADKTYQLSRAKVGEWLGTGENSESKKLQVIFKTDQMKAYIEQIASEVLVQPGTANVTVVDGQEISRTAAASGQSIAVDSAIASLEKQLRSGEQTVLELQVVNVPPKLNYIRTYSQASSGLQAIVRDWEAAYGGDYGIIVRELGGEKRYAEWQPDKRFVTASTYKMFVAYVVLTKVERGELNFEQTTDIGWTIGACMREMIHNSTNPCAISLMNLMGWEATAQAVKAAGFPATHINNAGGGDKYSTVRDETNFMMRVNAGTLMGESSTQYLLSLFKGQVWRSGIPSGVPRGVVVADKVGFYNGYIHDIAIVYAPKGTYILGVMSRGGTNPGLADLSRRVYNFFQN